MTEKKLSRRKKTKKKKSSSGSSRRMRIPFYVWYVHIHSHPALSLDLYVIHSILFFHLILFYFSLSSPSVMLSSSSFLTFFVCKWNENGGFFVVGDERRFKPSSVSPFSQPSIHILWIYTHSISIDSIEVQFYAALSFTTQPRKIFAIFFLLLILYLVSGLLALFFCTKSNQYQPTKKKRKSNRTTDRMCLCVCIYTGLLLMSLTLSSIP